MSNCAWWAVDNSNKLCSMTFWANKNAASHGQKNPITALYQSTEVDCRFTANPI